MMYRITLEKADFVRYQLFTASTSNRIKTKRIRTWAIVVISFLVLGIVLMQGEDPFLSYYFIGLSVVSLIGYPFYQRWQYRRHYERYIDENYDQRIGVESQLGFADGHIISIGNNQEGKIKLTEIEEINEIAENIFIKLRTGESFIVPTNMAGFGALKQELREVSADLDVRWNYLPDWRWS